MGSFVCFLSSPNEHLFVVGSWPDEIVELEKKKLMPSVIMLIIAIILLGFKIRFGWPGLASEIRVD